MLIIFNARGSEIFRHRTQMVPLVDEIIEVDSRWYTVKERHWVCTSDGKYLTVHIHVEESEE